MELRLVVLNYDALTCVCVCVCGIIASWLISTQTHTQKAHIICIGFYTAPKWLQLKRKVGKTICHQSDDEPVSATTINIHYYVITSSWLELTPAVKSLYIYTQIYIYINCLHLAVASTHTKPRAVRLRNLRNIVYTMQYEQFIMHTRAGANANTHTRERKRERTLSRLVFNGWTYNLYSAADACIKWHERTLVWMCVCTCLPREEEATRKMPNIAQHAGCVKPNVRLRWY